MFRTVDSSEPDGFDRAGAYQALGDGLTAAREQLAPVVGGAIAASEANWPVAAFAAATQLTDMGDGYFVRKAAAIRGHGIQTEGAEQDPRADRKLTHALMGGIATRALRDRDSRTASIVGLNFAVSQWRNKRMQENRQAIKDNDLHPDELRANKINKVKMWLQSAALTTLASPLAKNKRVRTGALITLSAGTLTGVAGERVFRSKVNRLLAEQSQNQSDV